MAAIHYIDVDVKYFNKLWDGNKKQVTVKENCFYKTGDLIFTKETIGGEITGRALLLEATNKFTGAGVERGWCVLSISIRDRAEEDAEKYFRYAIDNRG